MDVKGKKVTVLGMGESGLATAHFLREQGADVFISEGRETERTIKANKGLEEAGFETECGQHTQKKICEADLVVVSPGIKPKAPVYKGVESARIPLVSEIEVAAWFCRMPFIAVTGTNGKTTVTTLIAQMLNDNGSAALSCGNIGNPFIGEINKINQEAITPVVEVSSFQLMNTISLRPSIALLLNLDPDHLDWHKSLPEYYETKMRLFRSQTQEDYAVLNFQDPETSKRKNGISSRILYFNEPNSQPGLPEWNPNFDAALQVAEILGIEKEQAISSVMRFRGLEHRLERVESPDDCLYINDSKSTNLSSLIWALQQSFQTSRGISQKIILIAGGKNKGGDFSAVRNLIKEKTKHVILIGESRDEIAACFEPSLSVEKASSLEEAIQKARAQALSSDVILFSPACASFDMFINYQDRGRQYKELVRNLTSFCPKTVSASS